MVYQMVYQDDGIRKQNTPHPGSTRLACLLGVLLLALPFSVQAQGILENPVAGEAASGIGLVSGWFCDAQTIIVVFDSLPPLAAAYGTSRTDTLSDCGDTDNGFGLLFNFSVLGDGPHTVRVLADGVQFGSAAFTVATFETEFLEEAAGSCTVADFPEPGASAELAWLPEAQNFVITDTKSQESIALGAGPLTGSPDQIHAICQVFNSSATASLTFDSKVMRTASGDNALGIDTCGETLGPLEGCELRADLSSPEPVSCAIEVSGPARQFARGVLSSLRSFTDVRQNAVLTPARTDSNGIRTLAVGGMLGGASQILTVCNIFNSSPTMSLTFGAKVLLFRSKDVLDLDSCGTTLGPLESCELRGILSGDGATSCAVEVTGPARKYATGVLENHSPLGIVYRNAELQ